MKITKRTNRELRIGYDDKHNCLVALRYTDGCVYLTAACDINRRHSAVLSRWLTERAAEQRKQTKKGQAK